MLKALLSCMLMLSAAGAAGGIDFGGALPSGNANSDLVKFRIENQHDNLGSGDKSAIAIHLNIDKNWHFYASKEDAPGGAVLAIEPNGPEYFVFEKAILPQGEKYKDVLTGTQTHVLAGEFTVFVPFAVGGEKQNFVASSNQVINLKIHGALCSATQCRMVSLSANTAVTLISAGSKEPPRFEIPAAKANVGIRDGATVLYSTWTALGLAFIAGVILNIMPCVLPVIPLKVLGIFEQAKESKWRCITLGMAFSAGILLFFAALATANIILRLAFGVIFQWGDHFRNPAFIAGMAILMEILALIMFDVAIVNAPVISESTHKKGGYSGSVAMGFLAALLSTPCSFAILTAAFAWAQAQTLWLGTIAIMVIGIGMATPYAILTSMPSLLKDLPRPGRWMEKFKQGMGFVLLVVAIWLMSILPAAGRVYMLYFAVIIAFCVWMWGSWTSYNSSGTRRWTVRIIAIIIAVMGGLYLLRPAIAETTQRESSRQGNIEWQKYDAQQIENARAQNRPVLIEWTADWCLTCKGVEQTVYSRQDIQKIIEQKNVLTIKADTTWATNPASLDLQKTYNEPGIPVQMLFIPGEQEPVRFHGLLIGDQLKKFLEEL